MHTPEQNLNMSSRPSELCITDIKIAELRDAPMRCILLKIQTNQGLTGLGEVRDGASATYAKMLKSRILGENPCNVEKLFRKIRQFGWHGRQGGGVSGIEVALWDLAGKAYGVPVYQMLGGKYRDSVRMYCDTDAHQAGADGMAEALSRRIDDGFTFAKMDVGINLLKDTPGTLSTPGESEKTVAHPFTSIHITPKGLDLIEEYVAAVRNRIGYEIPLAFDHFGHIPLTDCIKVARRLERFAPAWLEDLLPWQYTDQYARLASSTTAPICTGEDIYLAENFEPLLEKGALAVVHPDVLTAGGILETKKVGDLAQKYGTAMAIHMAESPVGCLAGAHAAAATENFLALEFHSADVPWWNDMVSGFGGPVVEKGFVTLSDRPGLGIDDFDDQVLAAHRSDPDEPLWQSTDEWNNEKSHDRLWS